MAKRYGALVGTPSQTPGFPAVDNFCKDGVHAVLTIDQCQLPVGAAIGDQVSLGSFKSTAKIAATAAFWTDNLGAGVTFNVGDATYPSGLAAGLLGSAAGKVDMWKGFTPAKMAMQLWQALGYPADPGGRIELLATQAGAATANAGGIAWQIGGLDR